ncbi:MAG: MerR family transcriptional regulator [Solobacterium sp.]|jgi:DNA-binding transcriptional MerR regulator|nr:MerR family transcriptional regulator [Solobacterium sp.]MCH4206351.1 MerR family transcriptional regulator [Solobacterium sp.]MCH4227853.1 MerR family transcriptional regulator [Solobacterium sp.]MCH4283254.1 MerR family transcriptional regulator [Solobacterium sp.]
MAYSISEAAKILDILPSKIRYYDKEGLLPSIKRGESGYRSFDDTDVMYIQTIKCLTECGMSIEEIKNYVIVKEQDEQKIIAALADRHEMIECQMAKLKALQKMIDSLYEGYMKKDQ